MTSEKLFTYFSGNTISNPGVPPYDLGRINVDKPFGREKHIIFKQP
jgi:hypothetical protein